MTLLPISMGVPAKIEECLMEGITQSLGRVFRSFVVLVEER